MKAKVIQIEDNFPIINFNFTVETESEFGRIVPLLCNMNKRPNEPFPCYNEWSIDAREAYDNISEAISEAIKGLR